MPPSAASASALNAERTRIEVAVSNLANAESTRAAPTAAVSPPRRRARRATAPSPFDGTLGQAGATGVRVAGVVEDQTPFKRRYEPSHPDADADGFVALPNVDTPEEMVDMLSAARAYQANLTAIGLIRDMLQHALELGR